MRGPSSKKVGQGVLELLIRNEKVTQMDGPRDRPTDICIKISMNGND